jgi:hypothetical protein
MSKLPASLSETLQVKELTRRALFQIHEDLRRQARDSEDFELHRLVGEAYQAFLRSFLNSDERRFLELEDEIAELRNELTQWRQGQRRIEP